MFARTYPKIEAALLAAIALVPDDVRQKECDGRGIGQSLDDAVELVNDHGEYGVAYDTLLYLADECFPECGFESPAFMAHLDEAAKLMKLKD